MLRSTSFTFDGVSSDVYDLMIYFLDDAETRELSLGTDVEVIEDRIPKRTDPIHYGVDLNKSMTFPLTFGSTEYLEDYDVDAILSWLTGHQQYKWLEYIDGDHYVRYKCMLNNMQSVYINGLPVAFTCDVECDSQFAYEYPRIYEYDIDDTPAYIEFVNSSSFNGYIYPKLHIDFGDDCNTLSIVNESDNNREFKINYFDRVVYDTSKCTYTYKSTIAKEISESEKSDEAFLSWKVEALPVSDNYNEILKGMVNDKEVWVALPKSGTKAMFSNDKGESWMACSPALPRSGCWTGCFGANGFVAVMTNANSTVASYSQTGAAWTSDVIELPISQTWN